MRVVTFLPFVNLAVHVAGLYVGGHHKRSDNQEIPSPKLDPAPASTAHRVERSGSPHSPAHSESGSPRLFQSKSSLSSLPSGNSGTTGPSPNDVRGPLENLSSPAASPDQVERFGSRPSHLITSGSSVSFGNSGLSGTTATGASLQHDHGVPLGPQPNPEAELITQQPSPPNRVHRMEVQAEVSDDYDCQLKPWQECALRAGFHAIGAGCIVGLAFGCAACCQAMHRRRALGSQEQTVNCENRQAVYVHIFAEVMDSVSARLTAADGHSFMFNCPPHWNSAPQKGKRSFVKDVYRRRIDGWGDLDGLD
ncbi:hypothetical protein FB446DRAFT_769661 [Lentinula raphanica]|nr:hypothetical protein FB446DRAFT_769661 [Lentinula raphanica]